jgi:hypothetical protein
MKSLFLHGYGLSIKVQNSRLIFSQGIDPFSSNRDQVPLATHISHLPYRDTATNDNTSCIVGGIAFELPTYNDAAAFAKSSLFFGSMSAR